MRTSIMATASILVLAVPLATGCAGQAGTNNAAAPGAAVEAEATYQQLADTIYGTAGDRLAEENRVQAGLQRNIADCMKAQGHSYTPAPPTGFGGGPVVPGDLLSLAPVGRSDFGMATQLRRVAEAQDRTTNPGYQRLTTSTERKGYLDATKKCFAAPTPEVFVAAGWGELDSDLVSLFKKAEAQPEITEKIAAYSGCMTTAGFPASDYTALNQQVREAFPDVAKGWKAIGSTPEWAAAVDFERRAAAADTTCRTDLRAAAMQAAAPSLRQFADAQQATLKKAETSWNQQRALIAGQ